MGMARAVSIWHSYGDPAMDVPPVCSCSGSDFTDQQW